MGPMDMERVRARLPEREIAWFHTTDSTMTEAARLASLGCPAGTAVVAEEQLLGQGRLGRAWHSERYAGLYVSVILRPGLPAAAFPALTLALGLAAADAIARATGVACDLRWPNDLLVGAKKCAGILTQFADGVVIAGIGINVNHTSFPEDIERVATSLRLISGSEQSREILLVELLESIDGFCRILEENGKETILRLFTQASSYAAGRRVIVEQDGAVLRGVTAGLDESGFLRLRKDDGMECVIMAGGLRPA